MGKTKPSIFSDNPDGPDEGDTHLGREGSWIVYKFLDNRLLWRYSDEKLYTDKKGAKSWIFINYLRT